MSDFWMMHVNEKNSRIEKHFSMKSFSQKYSIMSEFLRFGFHWTKISSFGKTSLIFQHTRMLIVMKCHWIVFLTDNSKR